MTCLFQHLEKRIKLTKRLRPVHSNVKKIQKISLKGATGLFMDRFISLYIVICINYNSVKSLELKNEKTKYKNKTKKYRITGNKPVYPFREIF